MIRDIAYTFALHMTGLLVFAVLVRARRPVAMAPLAMAVGVLAVYWVVVWAGLSLQPHVPWLAHLRWNWLGKALAIVIDLTILAAMSGIRLSDAGVTWGQRAGWCVPALLVVALTCAFSWAVQALFDGQRHLETERLVYQATMPGLDEEIFWRGLLLAWLVRAFGRGVSLAGARFGFAEVAVTLLFAAGHSLAVSAGSIQFDGLAFAVTGLIGASLMWLRTRTGSLLVPVLAHNIVNVGNAFF